MEREEGGRGQFTSNLGSGWTRIAPHRKEGFQVSKRDSVTKEVIKGSWQEELTRGVNREGVAQYASYCHLVYMYHAIV
jgi:hypothetical protein